jgi:hypothetical protein
VLNATFSRPDLDSFCLLDRLGLSVIGQQVHDGHAVLACRVLEADDWCHECGCQGTPRDTVTRRLAHVPLGWRPTILQVRVRRYRCTGCGHVWRQDTMKAAAPRAKLSRHAVLWALKSVVIDRLSIARVAAGLGTSWHTVNDAVLAAGRELLINDPNRLDGVRVIGVDAHAWRHTRRGDKFVTVIITESGDLLTASLLDYLLPLADGIPEMKILIVDEIDPDDVSVPGRGIGEAGCIGGFAAIGCAIADATRQLGGELNALPGSPRRIFESLV